MQISIHNGNAGFGRTHNIRRIAVGQVALVCIRALPASYVIAGAEDRFSPVKLLVNSLCDANGSLMFAENEGELAMALIARP